MDRFDDNEYTILIGNLLHDILYSQISNMGKMALLRKHAEVLVRKILDIGSSKQLTLGQIRRKSNSPDVRDRLFNLGDEISSKLIITVKKISDPGNKATHTQHTENFSDEDIECAEDAILDLYALLFIKYFLKIQVNIYSPPRVLHAFSLLPPIIRYKTWGYLFEKDKNNIQVVNKLCLSIIKVYNKQTAYKWMERSMEPSARVVNSLGPHDPSMARIENLAFAIGWERSAESTFHSLMPGSFSLKKIRSLMPTPALSSTSWGVVMST